MAQTDNYTVISYNNIYIFYSRNKSKIDTSLIINNLSNLLAYNQVEFVYGIKDEGIYLYNAETQEKRTIINGQGDFNIKKVENNRIYYDETNIEF